MEFDFDSCLTAVRFIVCAFIWIILGLNHAQLIKQQDFENEKELVDDES
jgi:hypothetical protein